MMYPDESNETCQEHDSVILYFTTKSEDKKYNEAYYEDGCKKIIFHYDILPFLITAMQRKQNGNT